ncbi:MAG TPA: TlpA disulfide reductase family protein, partial [Burkholderiaceae bacterium]
MTTSRRAVVIGAAVGVTAAVAGGAVAWWRAGLVTQATERAADALWPLRFDKPEGGQLAMADFRGRPLVINFWATWCIPCVRELPALQRFAGEHAAKG